MNRQEVEEKFTKNMGLVYYVIKRRIFAPTKYGFDDLCQEGRIGLYKAILDYYNDKPELQKYAFSTVAYAYILRYLRNYVKTQNRYYKRYYATEDDKLNVCVDKTISTSFVDLIDLDLRNNSTNILDLSKKVLLDKQYESLLEIINNGYNLTKVANQKGVSRQAISYRYNRILRKLRENPQIRNYYEAHYD